MLKSFLLNDIILIIKEQSQLLSMFSKWFKVVSKKKIEESAEVAKWPAAVFDRNRGTAGVASCSLPL